MLKLTISPSPQIIFWWTHDKFSCKTFTTQKGQKKFILRATFFIILSVLFLCRRKLRSASSLSWNFKVTRVYTQSANATLTSPWDACWRGGEIKLAAALVRRITIQPLIKRIIGQTDDVGARGRINYKVAQCTQRRTYSPLIRSDLIVKRVAFVY